MQWGLAIQQHALARAWQAQAALRPTPPCPHCQSHQQRSAGSKARRIETRFGAVRLVRRRLRCRACGRHFQPDDAALQPLLGAGQCTRMLRELAAQCGASWPYRQAAQVLGMVRGVPLAAETVRQIVGTDGARRWHANMTTRRRASAAHRRPPHRRPRDRRRWRSSSMGRGCTVGTTRTAWRSKWASSIPAAKRVARRAPG